jgi:hypothetical protein
MDPAGCRLHLHHETKKKHPDDGFGKDYVYCTTVIDVQTVAPWVVVMGQYEVTDHPSSLVHKDEVAIVFLGLEEVVVVEAVVVVEQIDYPVNEVVQDNEVVEVGHTARNQQNLLRIYSVAVEVVA